MWLTVTPDPIDFSPTVGVIFEDMDNDMWFDESDVTTKEKDLVNGENIKTTDLDVDSNMNSSSQYLLKCISMTSFSSVAFCYSISSIV